MERRDAPVSVAAKVGHSKTIGDFFFNPNVITIPVGTTLRWTNTGNITHTSTSANTFWDSGDINPGETFSLTFDMPGEYPYFCTYHPSSMEGFINVFTPKVNTDVGIAAQRGRGVAGSLTIGGAGLRKIGFRMQI